MSLVVYLLVFIMSGLIVAYGYRSKIKLLTVLGLLLPILLAAFRYNVGTDFNTYVLMTNVINGLDYGDIQFTDYHNIELGFYGLIKACQFFSSEYALVFGVSSAITVAFFYLGLQRLKPNHNTLVYFLYLLIVFPLTLNAIRQGIAISICFYAFSFALTRNFKKFVILIIFASLFHLSALLFLPMYFVPKIFKPIVRATIFTDSFKILTFSVVAILALPVMLYAVLQLPTFSKYGMYLKDGTASGLGILLLNIIIFSITMLMFKRIVSLDKNNRYYIFLMALGLILSVLGYKSTAIGRLSLYFIPYSLPIVASYIDIFKNRFTRHIIWSFVVLYGLSYFILVYYQFKTASIIPYTFKIPGMII